MNKFYKLLLIFIITNSALQAQVKVIESPTRDSENRDTIHFRDYKIRESKEYYRLEALKLRVTDKMLSGRFMYQNSNGRTVDISLENNVATGLWQYYSSTYLGPKISSAVFFVDGYKHGIEYRYGYEMNSEIEVFETYLRGVTRYNMGKKMHDTTFWDNGEMSTMTHYDEDGEKHGKYISSYKNKSIDTEGEYVHGNRVGTWKSYYSGEEKRNALKSQTEYKGGKTHRQLFYKDGSLKEKRTLRARLYQDEYLFLEANGDTVQYHFYKDGIEQGKQVVNSFDGYYQPRYMARYTTSEDGVIQGAYTQQTLNNPFLRVEGNYNEKGERDGLWKYYLPDGRLYRTEGLENGRVRGSRTIHLYDIYTKQKIEGEYHLGEFPSGKTAIKKMKPAFFLFSE